MDGKHSSTGSVSSKSSMSSCSTIGSNGGAGGQGNLSPNSSTSESTWVHDIFEGTLTNETRCLCCEAVSKLN